MGVHKHKRTETGRVAPYVPSPRDTPVPFYTRACLWSFLSKQKEIERTVCAKENHLSGLEKGVITKGVFSLEQSLESLKSLNSRISRFMVGFSFVSRRLGGLQNL